MSVRFISDAVSAKPPSRPPPKDDDPERKEGVQTLTRKKVKRPKRFKVLLHNDDYTSMEFVVDVLQRFFRKGHTEATFIMLTVHRMGLGVCGVFPRDVAETKVNEVTTYARDNGHPLLCTMEAE